MYLDCIRIRCDWYKGILDLAGKLAIIFKKNKHMKELLKHSQFQSNLSNVTKNCGRSPSWLLFMISCFFKCKTGFLMRIATPATSLFVLTSIIVKNTLELSDETKGRVYWLKDNPFPKSLEYELQRWQTSKKSLSSTCGMWRGSFSKQPWP